MREYEKRAINYRGWGAMAWIAAGILYWAISSGKWETFILYLIPSAVVALAVTLSLLSLQVAIIGKIKEQNTSLAVVNGFSLAAVKRIVWLAHTEMHVAAKAEDFRESTKDGPDMKLPDNIQKYVDELRKFMNISNQKGFKTIVEFFGFLHEVDEYIRALQQEG